MQVRCDDIIQKRSWPILTNSFRLLRNSVHHSRNVFRSLTRHEKHRNQKMLQRLDPKPRRFDFFCCWKLQIRCSVNFFARHFWRTSVTSHRESFVGHSVQRRDTPPLPVTVGIQDRKLMCGQCPRHPTVAAVPPQRRTMPSDQRRGQSVPTSRARTSHVL